MASSNGSSRGPPSTGSRIFRTGDARAVYIELPTGTEGHPAELAVALVVVDRDDWTSPKERIALPGGEGTINVNRWSPDSTRFAHVTYPFEAS